MKLDNDMSLAEFRDEMQHRVVKYPLRSKAVREAVRFARRNPDTDFYRVAIDKIDAQKQFHHRRYGPSWPQRVADFLGGTPREAAVPLLVVVVALLGMRLTGVWRSDEAEMVANIDVDRLAERMGFYIDERQQQDAEETSRRLQQLDTQVSDKIDRGISEADIDEVLAGKFSSVINQTRFDEVLGERLDQTNLEKIVSDKLSDVLDQPTLKQLVADRVDQHVTAAGIKERVIAEFDAALKETKLKERIAAQIDSGLAEFDEQLNKRMSQLNVDLAKQVQAVLEQADVDTRVGERIAKDLTNLDKKLDDFDKQLLERAARFQEQIAASLRVVLDGGKIDQQVSQRIEQQLEKLDKQLANRLAAAQPAALDGASEE